MKQEEVKILTCEDCDGVTCKEVPTKFAYYNRLINKYKITQRKYRDKRVNIIVREYYSRACKLQATGIAFELCPSVPIPQGYRSELNSRYRMEYTMKKFTPEKIQEKIDKLFEATKHFIDLTIEGEEDPQSRMNREKKMLEDVSQIVKVRISSEYDPNKEINHYIGWFGGIQVTPNIEKGEYKMDIPVTKLKKQNVLHVIRAIAPFLRNKKLLKETL